MTAPITPEQLAKSGREDGEQMALFCYAAQQVRANKIDWDWLYAIPNGGKRGVATAAKLAATGVKAGYPDIGLDIPRHGFHGLRIELKRMGTEGKKPGHLSDAQKLWMGRLVNANYFYHVCFGWQQAARIIEWYLMQ